MRYLLAILGSCVVISLVALFIGASPVARIFDEKLGMVVPLDGSEVVRFSEGGARTRFGAHGFNPFVAERVHDVGQKVFLYGDSFVEALQVADEAKPDVAMTRSLNGAAIAFGVGRSGAGLKSFIKRAGCYERAFGRPVCHVFFVASVRDDLFHDYGVEPVEKQLEFSNFVNRFHLSGLLAAYTAGQNLIKADLNFIPGRRDAFNSRPRGEKDVSAVTRLIVEEIKAKVGAPVLIAYCPNVPQMRRGEISFVNDEANESQIFKSVVEASGIDYFDVTPALESLWQEKHLFARGFANAGGPGSGHLNEEGIEAVFALIANEVRNRHDL